LDEEMKMKVNTVAALFTILLVVTLARAEDANRILAHATGSNYGAVDTNVVVGATDPLTPRHRSPF
jgi:hypothetical protein